MRRRSTWRPLGGIAWPAIALALALGLMSTFLTPPKAAIFVVVAALAVVSLLRPVVGLALIAIAVPFGEAVPGAQIGIGPLDASLGEILMGFVLLGWLAGVLVHRERLTIGPLLWPIVAFLIAELLSAALAPDLATSAKELARWVQVIAIYLAAINLVRVNDARRLLLGGIFAAGASQALVGVYQFFAVVGPPSFQFDRFLRAYGTFGQPNPFAGYLEMVVPLGLALVFLWRSGRSDWLWWLALASALVGGLAILMSLSRGAWLGLAVGVVIAAAAAIRRGWLVAPGGAAVAAVGYAAGRVGLLPVTIADRVSQATEDFRLFDVRGVTPTDANYAVLERMAHWQAGWEMFRNHLLLGVGPGHYSIAYPQYAILPYWTQPLGHAHNIYINVAAETGLIGLIAYLVMVGSWLVFVLSRMRRLAAEEPTGLSRAVAVGVLGCLAAVAVHNFFDNLYVHMMNVQIGLLIGLASTARSAPRAAGREPVQPALEERGQALTPP